LRQIEFNIIVKRSFLYLIYYLLSVNKLNKWLTRKNGIWLIVIGVVVFLLNFLTYSLWEIDIDILGVMILSLGLVIAVVCGKSMKRSSKGLTRKTGVWICIVAVVLTALFAYSPIPVLNGDVGGISGFLVVVFGLIIIVGRWNH